MEIRVADSGSGMSKGVQSKLFEPLFTTRKGEGGQGLGLWLSRNLAERLGGSLDLEVSEIGKGSTFLLKLPIVYESDGDGEE